MSRPSKNPYTGPQTTTPPRYSAPSAWQRLACWVLAWAERLYLHAHGWHQHPPEHGANLLDEYVPPDDYGFRRHNSYARTHAVNAQRQCYVWGHYDPATPRRRVLDEDR